MVDFARRNLITSSASEGDRVAQLLFRVAEVSSQETGRVVVVIDCPEPVAPAILVGEPLEFRNPDGSVIRSRVSVYDFAYPPKPADSFAFPLWYDTPANAVQVGAEVWSLAARPNAAQQFLFRVIEYLAPWDGVKPAKPSAAADRPVEKQSVPRKLLRTLLRGIFFPVIMLGAIIYLFILLSNWSTRSGSTCNHCGACHSALRREDGHLRCKTCGRYWAPLGE